MKIQYLCVFDDSSFHRCRRRAARPRGPAPRAVARASAGPRRRGNGLAQRFRRAGRRVARSACGGQAGGRAGMAQHQDPQRHHLRAPQPGGSDPYRPGRQATLLHLPGLQPGLLDGHGHEPVHRRLCGLPSFSRRASMRPSDRSISFGCSAVRRARMASLAWALPAGLLMPSAVWDSRGRRPAWRCLALSARHRGRLRRPSGWRQRGWPCVSGA